MMIDLQSLLSSLVAITAALIGFWGVIYSQRKLALMAHEERVHNDKVLKDSLDAERKRQHTSFVNALLGELSALDESISNSIKLLQAQIDLYSSLASQNDPRKIRPRIIFYFATPVFDSHVQHIGILSPENSFSLSSIFGRIKSYSTQSQDSVPETDPSTAIRVMHSTETSLSKLQGDLLLLRDKLKKTGEG